MSSMHAIVCPEWGVDALALQEVDRPVVEDDAVLVRVHATSLNPVDWHRLTGTPYFMRMMGAGLARPKRKIPGTDVAGRVEAVGSNVTELRPGDQVFGYCPGGAFAEYVSAPAESLVAKPTDLTCEQAAAVPLAAFTALQGLRDKGKLEPGQSVLINGAAGGVGTFAVQIAKAFGAEVTGVCSTPNVEMVRSIGADHVIDYTRDDFTEGGRRYDILFDNMGNHPPSAVRSVLAPKGIYVLVGGPKKGRVLGPMKHLARSVLAFMFAGQKAALLNAQQTPADLAVLAELLESGKIVPVIDRSYELSEAPEAFRHLEQGHARGKIIITP